jgi:GTP-binding protein
MIMDIRHPLTELDRSLLEWFRPSGRPVHVLLSKSDKLSRGPAAQTLLTVSAELKKMGMNATAQLFSSSKKVGVDQAEGVVRQWLGVPKKSQAQAELSAKDTAAKDPADIEPAE